MVKKTNPLTKLLALGFGLFVLYQVFIAKDDEGSGATPQAVVVSETDKGLPPPVQRTPDVSAQESLNLLTQRMTIDKQEVNQQFDALQKTINQLQQENASLKSGEQGSQLSTKLSVDLETLRLQVERLQSQSNDTSEDNLPQACLSDDPLCQYDLVYADEPGDVNVAGAPRPVDKDGFIIIEPIRYTSAEHAFDDNEGGLLSDALNTTGGLLSSGSDKASNVFENATQGTVLEGALESDAELTPYLTIPLSTEIFGAVAVNAILGRVPRGGSVTEPYDFKVVVSGENMSANGFRVPNLKETIWRGTAVGDPSLTCVRGDIFAVTFIFQDGTIGHVHDGAGKEYTESESIAEIRDPYGNCVSGEVYGNEGAYIAAQGFADGVQAAGDAFSQAQYDSINSGNGITESLTGTVGKSVLGSFTSGTGSRLSEITANRYASVHNVIAVEPGRKLNIDIKKQIAIDYNPGGRKVYYEQSSNTISGRTLD